MRSVKFLLFAFLLLPCLGRALNPKGSVFPRLHASAMPTPGMHGGKGSVPHGATLSDAASRSRRPTFRPCGIQTDPAAQNSLAMVPARSAQRQQALHAHSMALPGLPLRHFVSLGLQGSSLNPGWPRQWPIRPPPAISHS
jgi:hypothetical protein